MSQRHIPRYQKVAKEFKRIYGGAPQFFSRAPGRVSVLGGHADYCGYNVLPAALEQDFLMAFTIVEEGQEGHDQIEVHNTNDKFKPEKLSNRAD